MKRGTSLLLVVTLMASVIAGALSVSHVSAKTLENSGTLYWDSLYDTLKDHQYVIQSDLRNFIDYCSPYIADIEENQNYVLFGIHETVYDCWVFSLFKFNSNTGTLYSNYRSSGSLSGIGYNNAVAPADWGSFTVMANMVINPYGFWSYTASNPSGLASIGYLGQNRNFYFSAYNGGYDSPGKVCYANRYDCNTAERDVFSSKDISQGSDNWSGLKNIVAVSPSTEFHYDIKSFTLGERRYLTITDQAIIRDIDPDKMDYEWYILNGEDYDSDLFDYRMITWENIVLVPGGENFLTGLTNVSPLGVYAYDITDLTWRVIYWSYMYDYVEGKRVGVVDNVPYYYVDEAPDPGTEGTSDSYTEIYNNIYNYTTNYPSDPVVPQELAFQLSGGRAISSGLGYVNPPLQIKQWLGVIATTQNTSWEYDLSRTGLDPDEMSMINFDLLSVAIVPARGKLFDRFCLQYWDYTLEWNSTDDTVPSQRISYCAYTDDLFEMYDLVIFCNTNAAFLGDTWVPSAAAENGLFGYTGDMTSVDLLDGELSYWILTRSALQKAQLFVFCDGFTKMYDIVSQYANKMDLWDNSFFSWSMSIFHELETLGGSLSHIDSLLTNLHLDLKLNDIIAGLNRIAENTDETQDPVWYVSLWNWVRDFTPSDDAFITGLTALDDGLNNIPALPVPTGSPGYPLLPTFTPTPSPDPGGV